MSNFHTRFNHTPCTGVCFRKPSLTQPQFQKDTDINYMIKRALAGDMSVYRNAGHIVDASEAPESYHESMNIMARAQQAWDDMPDALRRAYGNAANFLAEFEKSLSESAVSPSVESKENKADSSVSPSPTAEASMPKSVPTT